MTTARQIITNALTLHLNRLSPGETLDDDLAARCLLGLNDIADEWSGQSSFLWRTLLSAATVTGTTATLGTTWTDTSPGQEIQGATYNNGAGDIPMEELTIHQYHENVRIKTLVGALPRYWAHDGASTLYFYPACTGQTITIRAHQSISDFADLDTDYVMPQGYKAALSAVLAERMAPSVIGALPPTVAKAAQAAKSRLGAQVSAPAIIGGGAPAGNILSGVALMAARDLRIVGGSYYLRDRKTAVQRSVNCYPMRVEGVGEDAPMVLESAPGLASVLDFGAEVRGMRNADGRLFVVAGSVLYEVINDALSFVVSLPSTSGQVSMVNGTGQLVIVDGVNLGVYSLDTGAFTRVTSDGWRGSNRVDYLDGYVIFVDPGTEQFYISAIDDATALDALDFSSADSQPDNIIAHIVRKREAYFFGTRSCEVWINSGDPDFPFARYQGTPIDVGIVGPWAITKAADTLVWVGQTERGGPYVYRMDGYQPVRISDQCIEQLLEAADYTNATCWAYQEAGGEFVCINAPGMASTLVWDASTGIWHERADFADGEFVPFRIDHHAYFNGAHYVAGGTKLYRMSREFTDLAGDMLVQERTFPHFLQPNLEPVSYPMLEVRCTTGSASQGYITLEVSNDGGSVFGPPLRRSLGEVGKRQQRVRWLGLGTCPAGGSRVFRLRCTDSVPLTIQGATV